MAKKESRGTAWLRAYLSEDSPTFLNAAASAKQAGYGGKNGHSFRQLGYKNRLKFAAKISEWLEQEGFGEAGLKIRLLSLLESKGKVWQKVRGAVSQQDLPPGYRVVATSGTVITTKDGQVYGDGDTLLEIDIENYAVQVKSLDMALKMKGLYAPEKHEHGGELAARLQLTEEDRKLGQQIVQAALAKMMEAKRAKPA